jgi:hypothetical protein
MWNMSVKKRLLSIVFLVCLTQRVFSVEPGLPSIIVLSDHIANVVVVDLSKGLFSLLEHKDGELFLVKTVDTSIGKQGYDKFYEGDKKTPIGIYKIIGYKPDKTIAAAPSSPFPSIPAMVDLCRLASIRDCLLLNSCPSLSPSGIPKNSAIVYFIKVL